MHAGGQGHESIVRLLLEYLADVNAATRWRALAAADDGYNVDDALRCSAVFVASTFLFAAE